MLPIRLTDSELAAVFNAARPLPLRDRDSFLKAVAAELGNESVLGPGVVHRVCSNVQRRLFSPPLAVD